MTERYLFRSIPPQPDRERFMDYDPYRDDPEMRYRLDGDFQVPFLREVAPFSELVRTKKEKDLKVILVIPTKNEGTMDHNPRSNIGTTLDNLSPLKEIGLIDQVKVIDSDSDDDTAAIAREKGATVLIASEHQDKLGEDTEYIPGKGTNLRIAMADSQDKKDLLVFCDADFDASPAQIQGVLSPLIKEDQTKISLAWMIRETQQGDPTAPPKKGGRATEAGYRPVMELFYPELDGLQQPICGLYAIRGDAASECFIPPGYRVETAIITQLIDRYGPEVFAQTFCGIKSQTGQPSDKIAEMIKLIMHQAIMTASRAGRTPKEPESVVSYPTFLDENGITVIQREVRKYDARHYPPAKFMEK